MMVCDAFSFIKLGFVLLEKDAIPGGKTSPKVLLTSATFPYVL